MRQLIIERLSFLLFILLLFGCQPTNQIKPNKNDQDQFLVIPENVSGTQLANITLPPGAKTKRKDNHNVEFLLPAEHVFVWNVDGKLQSYEKACYNCTCTGSGCNVIYWGGAFACSECDQTCTGKFVECDNGEGLSGEVSVLNFSQENPEFITKSTNISQISRAPSFFFEIPEVEDALKAFNLKTYGVEDPSQELLDSKTIDVPIVIFGNLLGYTCPVDYLVKNGIYENNIYTRYVKVSCDCDSGTTGCDKKKKLGGYICEANGCTLCTMEIED